MFAAVQVVVTLKRGHANVRSMQGISGEHFAMTMNCHHFRLVDPILIFEPLCSAARRGELSGLPVPLRPPPPHGAPPHDQPQRLRPLRGQGPHPLQEVSPHHINGLHSYSAFLTSRHELYNIGQCSPIHTNIHPPKAESTMQGDSPLVRSGQGEGSCSGTPRDPWEPGI